MDGEMRCAADHAAHIRTPPALDGNEVCRHYGLPEARVAAVLPGVDRQFLARDRRARAPVFSGLSLRQGGFYGSPAPLSRAGMSFAAR